MLHVEAEQLPQVDLEQLLAGEPQSCQPRLTQPGAQRASRPPNTLGCADPVGTRGD